MKKEQAKHVIHASVSLVLSVAAGWLLVIGTLLAVIFVVVGIISGTLFEWFLLAPFGIIAAGTLLALLSRQPLKIIIKNAFSVLLPELIP
jgi:hypothetical protein